MSTTTATVALPNRFRLGEHVADGGMASVWAAEDRMLGRTVAIKLLAVGVLGDEDAVRRFEREARAAASVSSHPHVVTIFDVGEADGRPFIVMEYMAGGSLADVIRRERRIRRADALRWLREAAAALDFAHDQGLVHRDVKPGNLLLDDRGRLGVSDFGIARVAHDTTATATGQLMGTAAYLSPEQAAGRPAGPASDRYALALVAYELLTGARPFAGGGFPAQVRQHLEALPVSPSERAGELPPAVDRILLRGLEKDPDARWPSASAMVDALDAALEGDDTEATAVLPAVAAVRTTPAPVPAARPPGRHRGWLGAAVVAAAALVALLLASLGDDGGRPVLDRARTSPARTAPAKRDTTPARPPESIASLNDRGFALSREGRYDEAIPVLRRAVERCGDRTDLVCAYALFNLGHALRMAGRPGEAIPILERRLRIPNQQDAVRRELELARQQAGVSSGGGRESTGEGDAGRAPPGKGKGHHKKHKG